MPIEPRFSNWSFLLYAGAFTILASTSALLTWLAADHGRGGQFAGALLAFAAVGAGAAFLRRGDRHPIAAGMLAFVAAALFAAVVGTLLAWAGVSTTENAFHGFNAGVLAIMLAALVASVALLPVFRFPLLVWLAAGAAWFLVVDALSNGGDWSAIVSAVVALCFAALGAELDRGPRRPYGFWLHVWAALALGGPLLYELHGDDWHWALLAIAALAFVLVSELLGRASWAVVGTFGLLLAAGHFAHAGLGLQLLSPAVGPGARPFVAFAVTGVVLMALGGLIARRRAAQRVTG
jgi:hypothetical protein